MNEEARKKCLSIVRFYGETAQLGMLQEECAEVIQAVNKIRRKGITAETKEHLTEECADVLLLVNQFVACGFIDKERLSEIGRMKADRTIGLFMGLKDPDYGFTVREAMDSDLSGREEDIVMYRAAGKTLEEIGDMFRITRERVRQIHAKAAKKVKYMSMEEKPDDFFGEEEE